MSTEPGGRRRDARRRSRWRRTVIAVVGSLAIGTAGLAALGAVRGPDLDRGMVEPTALTERAGGRLVLEFDQPVAAGARVEVTPATPIETTVEAARVVVTFGAPLAFDTVYRVGADVVGAGSGRPSSVAFEFETPRATVTTLVRELDGDDRVERREVRTDRPEVLFAAPVIQEYALLDDAVAVVEQGLDGVGTVHIAPFEEAGSYTVPLDEPGTVRHLDAARGLVAFTLTPRPTPGADPPSSSVLRVFDTADPAGVARTVPGLDGAPLQVTDLRFVPGTTSLVVQTFDTGMLLVDPLAGTPPVPLGQHAELRGFLPGTTTLVVADPASGSTIDLATGETTVLDLPEAELEPGVYESDLVLLDPSRYVEVVARPIGPDDPFALTSAVVAVDERGTRVVFEPPTERSGVRELCVSPNGQYAAVAVAPPEPQPDQVPIEPSVAGVTTYLVDLADGTTAGAVPGFAIHWCR